MHLIHLTYQPSQLNPAYLKHAQNTYQLTVGQNHLTQSLFYNKVLNISCNLLGTVLKVKNRTAVWVLQDGSKCISRSPFMTAELPRSCAAAAQHLETGSDHVLLLLQKIKIQNAKYSFGVFLAMPRGLRNLSSPTWAPGSESVVS